MRIYNDECAPMKAKKTSGNIKNKSDYVELYSRNLFKKYLDTRRSRNRNEERY